MKENHIAYKIRHDNQGLVSSHSEFEEDNMLDLLKEIKTQQSNDIYWIFKQFDNQPKEALCIIDCNAGRIYYHYSGEVENIDAMIEKLSK